MVMLTSLVGTRLSRQARGKTLPVWDRRMIRPIREVRSQWPANSRVLVAEWPEPSSTTRVARPDALAFKRMAPTGPVLSPLVFPPCDTFVVPLGPVASSVRRQVNGSGCRERTRASILTCPAAIVALSCKSTPSMIMTLASSADSSMGEAIR